MKIEPVRLGLTGQRTFVNAAHLFLGVDLRLTRTNQKIRRIERSMRRIDRAMKNAAFRAWTSQNADAAIGQLRRAPCPETATAKAPEPAQ